MLTFKFEIACMNSLSSFSFRGTVFRHVSLFVKNALVLEILIDWYGNLLFPVIYLNEFVINDK